MSTATLTGFALSPQQQRLWRLHGPGCAPGFVVQGNIEIAGTLDPAALAPFVLPRDITIESGSAPFACA